MRHRSTIRSLVAAPFLAAIAWPQVGAAGTLDDVKHIVVIYMENRSFDNLYGLFPGAERHCQCRRDGDPGRQGRQALRDAAAADRHQPEAARRRCALPGRPAQQAVRDRPVRAASTR